MKCDIVKQNIDQYFYGGSGELDPQIREHLAGCQECNRHFREHEKAREVISRITDYEPVLNDPSGLTDDIMMDLPDAERTPETTKKIIPVAIFRNINFRRALSAAAMILFALFAYEQYLVLDKINRLETHVQKVSTSKPSGKDNRMYNAWELRTLRNFNNIKTNKKELFEKISSMSNNI